MIIENKVNFFIDLFYYDIIYLMDSIIYYIICIVFILKYSEFKLNMQCLLLVIFTLLFFSILKLESFATKRRIFVKKDNDDAEVMLLKMMIVLSNNPDSPR